MDCVELRLNGYIYNTTAPKTQGVIVKDKVERF